MPLLWRHGIHQQVRVNHPIKFHRTALERTQQHPHQHFRRTWRVPPITHSHELPWCLQTPRSQNKQGSLQQVHVRPLLHLVRVFGHRTIQLFPYRYIRTTLWRNHHRHFILSHHSSHHTHWPWVYVGVLRNQIHLQQNTQKGSAVLSCMVRVELSKNKLDRISLDTPTRRDTWPRPKNIITSPYFLKSHPGNKWLNYQPEYAARSRKSTNPTPAIQRNRQRRWVSNCQEDISSSRQRPPLRISRNAERTSQIRGNVFDWIRHEPPIWNINRCWGKHVSQKNSTLAGFGHQDRTWTSWTQGGNQTALLITQKGRNQTHQQPLSTNGKHEGKAGTQPEKRSLWLQGTGQNSRTRWVLPKTIERKIEKSVYQCTYR